MARTVTRSSESGGSVSLYRSRRYQSTALVALVLSTTGVAAQGRSSPLRHSRDLLVYEPAALIEVLEAARPAPVSAEAMGTILRALPPNGEVTRLRPGTQRKMDAVRELIKATGRDWYHVKMIYLPQAAVGLHARAVAPCTSSGWIRPG